MGYTQGKMRSYTPEWAGNREKPPSEQLVAQIYTPTEDDKRQVLVAEGNDQVSELVEGLRVQRRACDLFVKEITPFTWRGVEIKTGTEVRQFGPDSLMAELACEVLAELSLQPKEKKTSAPQSDSSPPETQASDGTAATVGAPDAAAPAAASQVPPAPLASSTSCPAPESSRDARKPGSEMKEETRSG